MADEGYDPKRSKVKDSTMLEWMAIKITGDLNEVPGIGPAAIKRLSEFEDPDDKITNTYQLFGKFLALKGPDSEDHEVTTFEHTQKFWHFLKNRGITAHRSAIVKAVAEKAQTFFPRIYDPAEFESDDEGMN